MPPYNLSTLHLDRLSLLLLLVHKVIRLCDQRTLSQENCPVLSRRLAQAPPCWDRALKAAVVMAIILPPGKAANHEIASKSEGML